MKSLITFFVFGMTFSFINAQDLIRNGGFENPDPFEFWDSTVTVTGASVQPVNTQPHGGNWSVEVKSGTTPIGGLTQLMQTLLTPLNNTDYRLIFWIKDSVTTSNFLGVYGLTGSAEVALGIDSLNTSTIINPDSGRITITQDFFQNWGRINYYFNSGQNYTGYILKFEEATSGISQTVYLDDFTISPVPGQASVQVTSPNGGEDWLAGIEQNVTWTSSNVTNVNIDYSTNNGAFWSTVAESVPAAIGTYSWTVPNTPSTECLVRIYDSSLPSVFDVSDNVFTITPALTVTAPNGGEDWLAGTQQNVTWTSSNVTNLKIDYSTDNGVTWLDIVASVPASSGSYSWTVPNTPSSQSLIRISDASNVSIYDVSDSAFTITAAVTVTSPNGGEDWTVGHQENITWISQNITNVKIEYSIDDGTTWSDVIASVPASSGSYEWTVPNTPSSQCLVRISDVSNAILIDASDETFSIVTATLTLTAPNGGENWEVQTFHQITWTSENITNIKIEYSTDNGSAWLIVTESRPAGTGTHNWIIPTTPSTECLVRVSDASNITMNDISDNTFTIVGTSSVQELKSGAPEEFALEQNYPNPFNPSTKIRFDLPEQEQVVIEVFNQIGEKISTILNSNLSAGYYEIQFDASNLPSGLYFYRIITGGFTQTKKMILMK